MTDITLSIPDISCDHCKNSIEGALKPLDGIETATVSIGDRSVAVKFDDSQINLSAIVEAIDGQGYEVAQA
ncbi:MAG: cation transporter [Actinomycetota bacterium]|nr:cation transporter [Actinomycetota bacterium]